MSFRVFRGNVKGLMLATRLAYNKMFEQESGAIYNMCGLGSDGRMIIGLTPYGTSKCSVKYFTEAFSREIKRRSGNHRNSYPGMVLTNLTLSQLGKDPSNDKFSSLSGVETSGYSWNARFGSAQ